jgi:hypothetical protein
MALRGTLKDFGIADILQLVGHQSKSGVLTVEHGSEKMQIFFSNGDVVYAEPAARRERDLLGRKLVLAQVVSEEQLEAALEEQSRVPNRLGQVLVDMGVLDRQTLAAFTRLQTTESIYHLFVWHSGTYEFTQQDVAALPDAEPIRCETLVMEGFRQLDDWPNLRRRIAGYALTFEKLEDLDALLAAAPAPAAPSGEGDLGDFDLGEAPGSPHLAGIGENERLVYSLIATDRDVQTIIDLSRLGEFETCKSLAALIDVQIIRCAQDETKRASSGGAAAASTAERAWGIGPFLLRLVGGAAVVAVLLLGLSWIDDHLASEPGVAPLLDTRLQSELSVGQMRQLAYALEVFRARTGAYPDHLKDLVPWGLASARDLRFPWSAEYHYARVDSGYTLSRPLY